MGLEDKYTHKLIMNEKGTTIINLDTGEKRFNPDKKLNWVIDNGMVRYNVPVSVSLEEFNKNTTDEQEISWYFSYD